MGSAAQDTDVVVRDIEAERHVVDYRSIGLGIDILDVIVIHTWFGLRSQTIQIVMHPEHNDDAAVGIAAKRRRKLMARLYEFRSPERTLVVEHGVDGGQRFA